MHTDRRDPAPQQPPARRRAETGTEVPTALRSLATLAALLERMEQGVQRRPIDAAQYRALALRVQGELARHDADAALHALLAVFPALAELYENARYDVAGLCLSPLERATPAEMAATAALRRAAAR